LSLEILTLPWQSALQELALMRTRQEWATSLEYLGGQLADAERCWFVTFDDNLMCRRASTDELHQASESTLVGQAWMNSEVVHRSGDAGCLVAQVEALAPCFALPVRSFGKVIGLLTLERVNHPPDLDSWASMLELVAHSWDTVGRLEDHAAYQSQTEALFVRALESLPSYRAGHVGRVAQMASELGRLLDLSAHQRQRLYRAGMYHDVGLLLSAVEHPQAGADYLRQGRVHADLASLVENHHQRYSADTTLGLEEWVLVLAEHFQEFCEAQAVGESVDHWVQRFVVQLGSKHHPAVVDALVGLSVAGKLEGLIPNR